MFYPGERCALIVDGPNLHNTAKNLGFHIDYRKLLAMCPSSSPLVRASLYTAVIEDGEFNSMKPVLDWASYNGWDVQTKSATKYTDAAGRERIKGNMDVEIAIDMLRLAMSGKVDAIALFSGDSDFIYVIEEIKKLGVRTIVVSTTKSPVSVLSDNLRRACDTFVDLSDIRASIERPAREAA